MPVGCKEFASTIGITLLGLLPFRIRKTWQEPAHIPDALNGVRINVDEEKTPMAGEFRRHLRA